MACGPWSRASWSLTAWLAAGLAFFEAFFRLPPDAQRAYLSGHDRPGDVAAAMARMALSLDPRLTALAVGSTLTTLRRATPPVQQSQRTR